MPRSALTRAANRAPLLLAALLAASKSGFGISRAAAQELEVEATEDVAGPGLVLVEPNGGGEPYEVPAPAPEGEAGTDDMCMGSGVGVYEFKGKIARSFEDSVEDWPEENKFTGNETNVLLIVLDDTGFAHLQRYGGQTNTTAMNRLADNGLLYTQFHTTALCSPSRGAILSGRNHHSVSLGSHSISAMGFPGYNGRIPYSAQEVTKTLQALGWTTYAIGKFDHAPLFQVHQQGPFTYCT